MDPAHTPRIALGWTQTTRSFARLGTACQLATWRLSRPRAWMMWSQADWIRRGTTRVKSSPFAYLIAVLLLELIMRRYERASTMRTSNCPVDDWGKLLGDTAAVTALLDRLLHHAHVLKCGPRSWRTKVHTDLQSGDSVR